MRLFVFFPRRILIIFFSQAHVLHFIVCSFLGRELPPITVEKKAHSRTAHTPNPLEPIRKQALLEKYGKKQVEEFRAARKAADKKQAAKSVNVCRGCDRQATTREIFKRCGACWNIDREALYCSEYVVNLQLPPPLNYFCCL